MVAGGWRASSALAFTNVIGGPIHERLVTPYNSVF
jgi:hypothetical protein